MGEQDVNDSPSLSSSLPSPQGDDVFPSPMIQIPCKDVDGPKESELIHDYAYLRILLLLLALLGPHLLFLTS